MTKDMAVENLTTVVLVIGGGPAGTSAAIKAASYAPRHGLVGAGDEGNRRFR
jgi:alkyl hydroperoxide reductase subunit AhpF